MGCLTRIGCGAVLVVAGAVGYATKDKWMPKVTDAVRTEAPAVTAKWEPMTDAGAERAKARINSLGDRRGPAYVTMTPSEFSSYVLRNALGDVARRDTSTQAVVEKGLLYIRTQIRVADLGGRDALGALGRMLKDTEPLLVGGTVTMVRPGLAQFRLKEVGIRDIEVPRSVVGTLVKRWGPRTRPDSLATDGLPVELPADVVDIRLAPGAVTLYKKTR